MSDSAARAERFGLPPASPSGYLWEVANKPVSVRFNLDTVDRLEREVVESFRSLSSRGSEIGGILLGSVRSGNPAQVSVESYELVPCDYARGPLYQFSEADVERFDSAAAQHGGSGGLRVVGYFRSHTRKGLGLDAEDTAFFTGHFRDPQQIALLIRPYASKPSTAGIFIWENGTVRGESSYLEFPFRRTEMERKPQNEAKAPAPAPEKPAAPESTAAAEKPPVRAQIVPIASRREIVMPSPAAEERPSVRAEAPPAPAAPARPAEKPAPQTSDRHAEPAVPDFAKDRFSGFEKPSRQETPDREPLADLVLPPLERPRRNNMVWVAAGSAVALLVLSGALLYPGFGRGNKHAAAAPVALSLRVERGASDLLLTWNRDSDAIKTAARAVLTISDGDQHENVNLDLAQLRNGSVSYSPATSDVSFQLSIVGQNSEQTHSESVRVLKTTKTSPLADAPAAPAQRTADAPPQRTEAAAPSPAAPAATRNPEPTLVADNRTKPSAPALKEFHSESLAQRLRPTTTADLPEAPGMSAAAPVAVAIPGLNTGAIPAAPPISVPSVSTPARPTNAGQRTGGQIQSAQLVSSKPPEYPLAARQAHVQGVVEVLATIGIDGKVKAASAVSGPPLLRKPAVDAVRQWTYKPTTLDGAAIESETHVEVRFTTGH